MTFNPPSHGPGDIPPFNGTPAQLAKNRLSHAWEQIVKEQSKTKISVPAKWQIDIERLGYTKTDEIPTTGRCKECGVADSSDGADWPCGEAPVLGSGEYYYNNRPRTTGK